MRLPKGLAPRGDDAAAMLRVLMRAGIRHRLGARGPEAFDCWSTTQLVQAHLFGRQLLGVDLGARPSRTDVLRAMRGHPAYAQWREAGLWGAAMQPRHGDVVTMAHRATPWHVGTFLAVDRGVVVHCEEHAGLSVDDRSVLAAKGFGQLLIHRFAEGRSA